MLIEIKNKFTENVIFAHDVEDNTVKLTVEEAVRQGVSLSEASLYGANLDGANLSEASLYRTNLSSASLDGANLSEASLDGANLSSASLDGANLSEASLRGANLSSASLDGANLSEASLRGANLSSANLDRATYGDATFMRGFRQLLGAYYPVFFFDSHIKIGCKLYTTEEWRNFTDSDISKMDESALEFWHKEKTAIMAIADAHQKNNA